MLKLTVFNLILVALITGALILCKKFITGERSERILFFAAAHLTVLCHYSSLLYHLLTDGKAMEYLSANPNLLLPIYPCNVVMWCCVIYSLLKNKKSRVAELLSDYIFWFGVISALVGMFANVDFIREPSLASFDVTKGIIAHAAMLFNILLFPVFGKVRIDVVKNMIHITVSIVSMFLIGLYCNLVFEALVSWEMASSVNSMFILHSPFAELPYLTFPIISVIALAFYLVIFLICDAVKKRHRGNRAS